MAVFIWQEAFESFFTVGEGLAPPGCVSLTDGMGEPVPYGCCDEIFVSFP